MFGLRSRQAALLLVVLALLLIAGPAASQSGTAGRAGTIAFLRWPPGATDYSNGPSLYVVRADGTGLRRLTPRGTSVYGYAWSPDGSQIAYIDRRALSLWLVRPDGTGRRLLLPSSELSSLELSWSPDGKQIAITSPGQGETLSTAIGKTMKLYVVPLSGASPTRLPGVLASPDVAWSPRGDEIVYDSGGLSVVRPDGTGRRQISHLGGGWPQWSQDGGQLAFGVAIRLRSGRTVHYRAFAVVDADGTGFHVVTTHAYSEYPVAWAPSGRRILYGRADNKGIYVIGADGRNNHRVTRDPPPGSDWPALAWSPHGGSIVYATNRTGNGDLYLIGVDGRGKVRLTSTPDQDIDPTWVAR